MRLNLFVSAVFAASLFAGGALADRPGDEGGGRTGRLAPVKEMRVREVREGNLKETRPQADTQRARVRDAQVTERFRNRGDMVDRYTAPASTGGKGQQAGAASIKSQRAAEKALERLNSRKNQVINCSPTDDSCSASARVAQAGSKAAQQQQTKATADVTKQQDNRQRAEIQKKIDEIRAEKMKEKLMKSLCEKKANICNV